MNDNDEENLVDMMASHFQTFRSSEIYNSLYFTKLLYPYHVQRTNTSAHWLKKSIQFCRKMAHHNRQDPQFLTRIFWNDQSSIKRLLYINIRNLNYWEYVNLILSEMFVFGIIFVVNFWAEIIQRKLIGPFELSGINGENYLRFFLQHNLDETYVMYLPHISVPSKRPRYVAETR